MSWKPCAGNHAWEPLLGWYGRYKCTECFVLGYRGTVLIAVSEEGAPIARHLLTGPIRGKAQAILPYKCPKCKGPTTTHHKGKSSLCPKCQEQKG